MPQILKGKRVVRSLLIVSKPANSKKLLISLKVSQFCSRWGILRPDPSAIFNMDLPKITVILNDDPCIRRTKFF